MEAKLVNTRGFAQLIMQNGISEQFVFGLKQRHFVSLESQFLDAECGVLCGQECQPGRFLGEIRACFWHYSLGFCPSYICWFKVSSFGAMQEYRLSQKARPVEEPCVPSHHLAGTWTTLDCVQH